MKIEYVYKKEHQNVLDRIKERLEVLKEERCKTQQDINNLHLARVSLGCESDAPIAAKSDEEIHLEEQISYLKSVLIPETIRVIEEVGVDS